MQQKLQEPEVKENVKFKNVHSLSQEAPLYVLGYKFWRIAFRSFELKAGNLWSY